MAEDVDRFGVAGRETGKGAVDQAGVGQRPDIAGVALAVLDQRQRFCAEMVREPDRQAVGGHRPAFRDVGRAQTHARRQPDRRAAMRDGVSDHLGRGGGEQARLQVAQHQAVLLHGEQAQAMRRGIAEMAAPLRRTHRVGERTAAGYQHDAAAGLRQCVEPAGEPRRIVQTAAQFHDSEHCSSACVAAIPPPDSHTSRSMAAALSRHS